MTNRHMVRYTVRPDEAEANRELVRAIFADLDTARPAGLRYAVLELDDGQTFIHLIARSTHTHPLRGRLDALRAFHAGLAERCETPPVRTGFSVIDSFQVFDESAKP